MKTSTKKILFFALAFATEVVVSDHLPCGRPKRTVRLAFNMQKGVISSSEGSSPFSRAHRGVTYVFLAISFRDDPHSWTKLDLVYIQVK
ncbi:hypothetical protein EVAR_71324_1 [Eumeta japonica]|uniref:Uncharacterized protein n=1 Tax=Eumeta variegata TaxID=151549 RepID=A0A4C1SY57_EUMVA|nr:hypothetical protein EVAR_71324_1 [Eumeta japonica]